MVVAHVFVLGLYRPPVLKIMPLLVSKPPQAIISLPVQTAVCAHRESGALLRLVAVQLFSPGLYLPPVLNTLPGNPPQTIISVPVQTAVW
jgi:hypothetical protein